MLDLSLFFLLLIKVQEKTGKTGSDKTKNVEIMVSLKYLSNFWITLEMPFINFEIIVWYLMIKKQHSH